MKKLSAYCLTCGEPHSKDWMQWYIDNFPVGENKRGGILCALCLERSMREMASDDEAHPKIRAFAQRVVDVLDRERTSKEAGPSGSSEPES